MEALTCFFPVGKTHKFEMKLTFSHVDSGDWMNVFKEFFDVQRQESFQLMLSQRIIQISNYKHSYADVVKTHVAA